MHTNQQRGFSLIELSIVLIIIGLILGGILAGQNLLNAAEMRSIYTDAETFITSINRYSDKYSALPGDMYNAEDVWGEAAAGAACDTTNNGDKTTCNGDGNGQITLGTITVGAGPKESNEAFRAWQHLSNAGMTGDTFTGVQGSAGNNLHAIPGTNVPRGQITGTGFTLQYLGTGVGAGTDNFFPGTDYGHILIFGQLTAANITDAPAVTTEQAVNIDNKVDDGLPWSGKVRTYHNTAQGNCADADDNTAVYDITGNLSDRNCNLIFVTGF